MKNYYWILGALLVGLIAGFYLGNRGCSKPLPPPPIVITEKAIRDSIIVLVDSSKDKLATVNKWLQIKDKENAKITSQLRESRLNEKKAWDYVNVIQNPTKTTLDSLKALADLNNENCDLLVIGLERVISLKDSAISIKDTLQAKTVNLLDAALKRGNTWQDYSHDLDLNLKKEKNNKKFWRVAAIATAIGGFYLGSRTN